MKSRNKIIQRVLILFFWASFDNAYGMIRCGASSVGHTLIKHSQNHIKKCVAAGAVAIGTVAYAWNKKPHVLPLDSGYPIDVDAELYPEFAKFLSRYRCSQELAIENAPDQFLVKSGCLSYHDCDGAKGCLVDTSLERIINAQRLKNYIKEQELKHIDVAQKCLHKTADEKLVVVASRVSVAKNQQHTLAGVKELSRLVKDTHFCDWGLDIMPSKCERDEHGLNVLRNQDGQYVFIDTENKSFGEGIQNDSRYSANKHTLIQELAIYCDDQTITPEAAQWLTQELWKTKIMVMLGQKRGIGLYENSKYDDPGIDFNQVAREYKQWKLQNS